MKLIAEEEYIGMGGVCRACGSGVARYACNKSLVEVRPEAEHEDWWASCSNAECQNHYGESYFQMPLSWVKYDWKEN